MKSQMRNATFFILVPVLLFSLVAACTPSTDPGPVNQPPVSSAMTNIIAGLGQVVLSVSADDPDNDALTYQWVLSNGPGTPVVSGETTSSLTMQIDMGLSEGVYTYIVLISDNQYTLTNTVAVTVEYVQKILASDPYNGGYFGFGGAISGDGTTAIIGADSQDVSGAAYIFTNDGVYWTQSQKLSLNHTTNQDYFGEVVDINYNGTIVAIDAWGDKAGGANSGAIYIYKWNGSSWIQNAKLKAPVPVTNELMGLALAMDDTGTTLVAGSKYYNNNSGRVLLYTNSGSSWGWAQTIISPDNTPNDSFGWEVDLDSDGSTLFVSAPGTWKAVYTFERSGANWTQDARITNSLASQLDGFGYGLATSDDGNTLFVGAPYRTGSVSSIKTGVVYPFTKSGASWTQGFEIYPSDGIVDQLFGEHVAITPLGNMLLVSGQDTSSSRQGSAYLFSITSTNWTELTKFVADVRANSDFFGNILSISDDGTKALIGCRYDDDTVSGSGSVYFYNLNY